MENDVNQALGLMDGLVKTLKYNLEAIYAEQEVLRSNDTVDPLQLLRHKAYALYYAGFDYEACIALNAAVAVEPDWFSVAKLAQIHLRQGNHSEAIKASDWALSFRPDDRLSLQTKAAAQFAAGDAPAAFETASRIKQSEDSAAVDPRISYVLSKTIPAEKQVVDFEQTFEAMANAIDIDISNQQKVQFAARLELATSPSVFR